MADEKKKYSTEIFNNMFESDKEVAITRNGSGERQDFDATRSGRQHGGVDLNFKGLGQNGENLTHPTILSPVDGIVKFGDGNDNKLGEVRIVDAEGNTHGFLHLDTRSVKENDIIKIGDPIGTMGGRGASGPNAYPQHLHYQIKDSNDNRLDPEKFWDDRDPKKQLENSGVQEKNNPAEEKLTKEDQSACLTIQPTTEKEILLAELRAKTKEYGMKMNDNQCVSIDKKGINFG